jgi:hypothetical protein
VNSIARQPVFRSARDFRIRNSHFVTVVAAFSVAVPSRSMRSSTNSLNRVTRIENSYTLRPILLADSLNSPLASRELLGVAVFDARLHGVGLRWCRRHLACKCQAAIAFVGDGRARSSARCPS